MKVSGDNPLNEIQREVAGSTTWREIVNIARDSFGVNDASEIYTTPNESDFSYDLITASKVEGIKYNIPYYYLIDSFGNVNVEVYSKLNDDSTDVVIGVLENAGYIASYPIYKLNVISDLKGTLNSSDSIYIATSGGLHGPYIKIKEPLLVEMQRIRKSNYTPNELTNIKSYFITGRLLYFENNYPELFRLGLGGNFNCKEVNCFRISESLIDSNKYCLTCKKRNKESLFISLRNEQENQHYVKVEFMLYSSLERISLVDKVSLIIEYNSECLGNYIVRNNLFKVENFETIDGLEKYYLSDKISISVKDKKRNKIQVDIEGANIFDLMPLKKYRNRARPYSESVYSQVLNFLFKIEDKECSSNVIKSIVFKTAKYKNYKEGANTGARKFKEFITLY